MLPIPLVLFLALAPQREAVALPELRGAIAGCVLDAAGAPVVGASVVLCAGASGVPLHAASGRSFVAVLAEDGSDREAMRLAHVRTGDDGSFRFADVPEGSYRLLAQTWLDAERPIDAPLEVNGARVRLDGVADGVAVPTSAATRLVLRPLGRCALALDQRVGNDETLVVVSRAPLNADPILGFAGWAGGFLRGMLGGNRMPKGITAFEGLPVGVVHVAVYAADDNPGFGADSVELVEGETRALSIPFVASWSDAKKDPPPRLAALVEELAGLDAMPSELEAIYVAIRERERAAKRGGFGAWAAMVPCLDRPAMTPRGARVRMADLMAAWGYLQLAGRAPGPR